VEAVGTAPAGGAGSTADAGVLGEGDGMTPAGAGWENSGASRSDAGEGAAAGCVLGREAGCATPEGSACPVAPDSADGVRESDSGEETGWRT
jgi:hypothetical protein